MTTYCSNCGAKQEGDEKFCAKCGQPIATTNTPQETKNPKSKEPNYGILSAFHISDEEFSLQVANHDTLTITKSSRGIAVLTIIGLLALGIAIVVGFNVFGSDLPISFSDIFGSLIIYLPLLYFVYKGHLWAVVVLGLFYTADKLYTAFIVSPTHFNIGALFFWIIGVGPLWVAFRVEQAYRNKRMLAATT